MSKPFTLDATYCICDPTRAPSRWKAGAGIAERRDLDRGRLMGKTVQTKDWDDWERHPAGDEILILLSGELELVLEMPDGEQRAVLQAGETFVVPRGVWHRGIVRQPGQLMFITPGGGTEHRPVAL
jgi:mannose-6-phosphate isomerase-like protein (cupin superfamily)